MSRKCFDAVLLTLVLLVAADRYYPAVMCALGIGAC